MLAHVTLHIASHHTFLSSFVACALQLPSLRIDGMMRSLFACCLLIAVATKTAALRANLQDSAPSRRAFLSKATTAAVVASVGLGSAASAGVAAAPEIVTTSSGIKYATIKPAVSKGRPLDGDIAAIEYTGYLTDGTIFGEYE